MKSPYIRLFPLALLALLPALLLSGCGGGGRSSNNPPQDYNAQITGKIVDTSGAPVPAAVIQVDGVQQAGATYSQGGYAVSNITPGFHIITAEATVAGQLYSGTTQIGVPNQAANNLTNANIIVSPPTEQATVGGFVYNQSGTPLAGARVYFQSSFSAPPTGTSVLSAASLVAITDQNGQYQITNLPVMNTSTNTARTFTVSASYQTGNNNSFLANSTLNNQSFTAGGTVTGLDFHLNTGVGISGATPTLDYIQAFTQPDIPADAAAHAVAAAQGGIPTEAIYQHIREVLSPKYAEMIAKGHASSNIKHLSSAATPHATSNNYVAEMDIFFHLPGDTATTPDPIRNSLSGFQIDNNAFGTLQPYDFLQDPLANIYADPDFNATRVYAADTTYSFSVQSVEADGATLLGQSNTVSADPLEFLNLTHPADPNDTGVVETLPNNADPGSPPVIEWNPILGAQDYFVLIYSSFPSIGVDYIHAISRDSTNPITNANATSYQLPAGNGLVAGQEYWVVVAATAASNPANSSAITVSQIVPFYVQ